MLHNNNDLIGKLHGLTSHDKKTIALLRAACGNDYREVVAVLKIFGAEIPDPRSWDARCFATTACLFAWLRAADSNDIRRGRGNLGEVFRFAPENPSRDHRFKRLIDSDETTILPRIRESLKFLHTSCDPRIDWMRLLRDLCAWNKIEHDVQLAWAASYYQGR